MPYESCLLSYSPLVFRFRFLVCSLLFSRVITLSSPVVQLVHRFTSEFHFLNVCERFSQGPDHGYPARVVLYKQPPVFYHRYPVHTVGLPIITRQSLQVFLSLCKSSVHPWHAANSLSFTTNFFIMFSPLSFRCIPPGDAPCLPGYFPSKKPCFFKKNYAGARFSKKPSKCVTMQDIQYSVKFFFQFLITLPVIYAVILHPWILSPTLSCLSLYFSLRSIFLFPSQVAT